MSEINRCGCGGETRMRREGIGMHGPYFHVECEKCFTKGPQKTTEAEAITAWNTAMRPRPRVKGWVSHCVGGWEWTIDMPNTADEEIRSGFDYPTEAEALAALREFCEANGFELEVEG